MILKALHSFFKTIFNGLCSFLRLIQLAGLHSFFKTIFKGLYSSFQMILADLISFFNFNVANVFSFPKLSHFCLKFSQFILRAV